MRLLKLFINVIVLSIVYTHNAPSNSYHSMTIAIIQVYPVSRLKSSIHFEFLQRLAGPILLAQHSDSKMTSTFANQ